MHFHRGVLLAVIALCAGWVAGSAVAAETIAPEHFERLHSLIRPRAEEQKWAEIPWRASLWEARVLAAREGKPILLWEMDGHPLGCT
jgi:hypothetical protein